MILPRRFVSVPIRSERATRTAMRHMVCSFTSCPLTTGAEFAYDYKSVKLMTLGFYFLISLFTALRLGNGTDAIMFQVELLNGVI
jgi:hypothetical protein